MVAIVYVERVKSKRGNKVYQQILLRESYREPGAARSRVKHRTLLNLTHCSSAEVAAIEMALKYKGDLGKLQEVVSGEVCHQQGRSVGAVWLLYRIAQSMGLVKALGPSQAGRRSLWQVLARLIDQGSRLSAVRLAGEHAACEVLGLDDFSEKELYQAMDWLDERQEKIEDFLYRKQHRSKRPQLFLYDVTSSYLEGKQNEYGAYGYNRDGKSGKLQIVVGLLTDGDGLPISISVFEGNTLDQQTVSSQIHKIVKRFGVREVTLVGDRGMLKRAQCQALNEELFHYLTAITKPQIESLLKGGVLQLEMFDESIYEVEFEGNRYLLRRNPVRAAEIAASREDKFQSVCRRVTKKNIYLNEHPRAQVAVVVREIGEYLEKLRIEKWVRITIVGRQIAIERDEKQLQQAARLDGCYVLKTDVPKEQASADQLHARYKDLTEVEQAFRTMKTGHLRLRPVYVRTAAHTRAHVFIVMLAYQLRCELKAAWRNLDITVEEGLKQLSTLSADQISIGDHSGYLSIPEPRHSLAQLFAACKVNPPTTLPRNKARVATKRKLTSRRKTN